MLKRMSALFVVIALLCALALPAMATDTLPRAEPCSNCNLGRVIEINRVIMDQATGYYKLCLHHTYGWDTEHIITYQPMYICDRCAWSASSGNTFSETLWRCEGYE